MEQEVWKVGVLGEKWKGFKLGEVAKYLNPFVRKCLLTRGYKGAGML